MSTPAVKVERAESPIVITLDAKSARQLAGLLIRAISFSDHEWADALYLGIAETVGDSGAIPDFHYDSDLNMFAQGAE